MRRAARILGFTIASLSALTLIGVSSGTALGTSQAQNAAPDTPSNLATEFPQAEPVLHATFSDRNGGQGQVLYTVFDLSTGGVVLQDAPGLSVASGSDSPYTIPTGTLVDSITYGWTARSFDGSAYSAATTEPNFVATSDSSTSSLSQQPEDTVYPGVSVYPQAVPSCTEPCIQQVIGCTVGLNHTVGNPPGAGYTVRVIGSVSCAAPITSIDISVRMETRAGTLEAEAHDTCGPCASLVSRAVRDFVVPGSRHVAKGDYVLVALPGYGWTNLQGCLAMGQVTDVPSPIQL